MPSKNNVNILGHIGSKDVNYTQDGDEVTNLSVATNQRWKDDSGQTQTDTEWHRVVVFGQQAKFLAEYASKGDLIDVEGRLQTREWEDQAGDTRYTTEIVGQSVELIGEIKKDDVPEAKGAPDDFDQSFDDDDIPF